MKKQSRKPPVVVLKADDHSLLPPATKATLLLPVLDSSANSSSVGRPCRVLFYNRATKLYMVIVSGSDPQGESKAATEDARCMAVPREALKSTVTPERRNWILDDGVQADEMGCLLNSSGQRSAVFCANFFNDHHVFDNRWHIRDIHTLLQALFECHGDVPRLCARVGASDFCWTLDYSPVFYAQLLFEGFLPISTECAGCLVVLPKLHKNRCLLQLRSSSEIGEEACSSMLHVSKTTRKHAKKYRLCCRTSNLNEVIDGCIAQHGENWLYPHIRAILRSLTRSVPVVSDIGNPQASVLTPQACISARGSCGGGSAKDDKSAGSEIADKSSKPNKILHQGVQGPHIRTVAIELRHKTSGKLVAGELGVIVGAIYMSLSGFYTTSGTGTIQLVALGAYLRSVGCHLWDFGMGMEYKLKLGATNVPRAEFIALFRKLRTLPPVRLPKTDAECVGATLDLIRTQHESRK